MKNRILAWMLAGAMMIVSGVDIVPELGDGLLAQAADYTEVKDGSLTYKVYSTYAEVAKCDASVANVTVPAYVEEKPVISVGSSAFSNYGSSVLDTVELPDTLISIGNSAFRNCQKLQNINLPDSIKEIKSSAFAGCISLTSIDLPDTITVIPYSAFTGCTLLANVSVPSSVTTIGSSAFKNCGLKNVKLHEGITAVEEMAFQGCPDLISVTLPSTITRVGSYCFSSCPSLTSIHISEGANFGSWGALSMFENCTSLREVTIPKSIGEIPTCAFQGCTSLSSVSITKGITKVDSSAFNSCTSLEEIVLPVSVKKIEDGAFKNCQKLRSVTIENGACSIGVSASTISNYTLNATPYFNGTIYSTEETGDSITTTPFEYAQKTGYHFKNINAQIPTDSTEERTTDPIAPAVAVGDLNGDGVVNASDASLILIYAAAVGAGYQGTLPDYFAK